MTIIVPARPARPIVVEGQTSPDITVQAGRGLPPGGTAGQALIKSSDSDFAAGWGSASSAWGSITGTLASQTDLAAALSAKQDTLVSGANIKTLNGSTILGSGDLVISASAAWGGITGTLSAQTDLNTALGLKADTSSLAAVATSGSASDLGTGTLPIARIADGAVTLAKQANMATASVVYRKTAGSGAPEVQTLATLKTDLGLTGTNSGDQTITLTSDVTGSGAGSFATTLATVNANVGSFGSATQVATFTVDGKGRTTAAGNTTIAIASTAITDFNSAARAQVEAELIAGTNVTITPGSSGATRTLTIAASGGGGGSLTVQDEGSTLSTAVTTINFTGAGVTATGTTTVTVNVPGGGSSATPWGHIMAARQGLARL